MTVAAPAVFQFDSSGNQISQTAASSGIPSIRSFPTYQVAAPGAIAGFSVNASSVLPITYQWNFNGDPINGAAGDSLLLEDVSSSQQGSYTVTVTNSLGSVTSAPARLYVTPNPGKFLLWIGGSGSFNDPANWNEGRVPGAGDFAVIDSGSFTLPVSGTLGAANVTVDVPLSSTTDVTLNVSGTWRFRGGVSISAGRTLRVHGNGDVVISGNTALEGVSLQLDGVGTSLSLAGITNYVVPPDVSPWWNTSGEDCLLAFPNLVSIQGSTSANRYFEITANYGGSIELPKLESVIKPPDGDAAANSAISFNAHREARISAPLLASFEDQGSPPASELNATRSGILAFPSLLEPVGVNLYLNAESNPQQFTSLVGTRSFRINSGTVSLDALDTIESLTLLSAEQGAKVTVPGVTSYTWKPNQSVDWRSSGDNSELIFPDLTGITGSSSPNRYFTISAEWGGAVKFPLLAAVTKPADGDAAANSGINFTAHRTGVVLAPQLASFEDQGAPPASEFNSYLSGVLDFPLLLAPVGVNLYLNAESKPQQFTSLVNTRSFRINSGTVSLSALDTIENLTLLSAEGGAKVTVPGVNSYTCPANQSVDWRSNGDGSELIFPGLFEITGSPSPNRYFTIYGEWGGAVKFPLLATVTKPADGDAAANSAITFTAHRSGSIQAPVLTSFVDQGAPPASELNAYLSGILDFPHLFAPVGVNVYLNAESTPQKFTSLINCSTFRINSGTVTMAALDTIASFTSIRAEGAAKLTFPNVTAYTQPPGVSVEWLSTGDGSELIFPQLEVIHASATPNREMRIVGEWGGLVLLPALKSILKPADGDSHANSGVRLIAHREGEIRAPILESFQDLGDGTTSILQAYLEGSISLPRLSLAAIHGVALSGVVLPEVIVPGADVRLDGNSLVITVVALPGHRYQLQSSASLAPPAWANVGTPRTGSPTLEFTVPREGSVHFYRIEVTPLP